MTKTNILPMLADRFLNTPLLLDPSKAAVIYGVLSGRMAHEINVDMSGLDIDEAAAQPIPEATRFAGSSRRAEGGYSVVPRSGGVGIISVVGSLVNRGAFIGASSGAMSYEGIGAQIDTAKKDGELKAVILDLNSPGGEATGMFAVAQKVRELAAIKPVIAMVNDVAASAAYGIASGATEIVISPTSFVGSIGVVMVHMDHSGELKKKGVKPTILQRGANKTHGNPFGPLSNDANAALNEMMTVLYDQFLGAVALGRGDRLTADAARLTEATVFVGQQAIDAGVADRIGTFDDVLAELQTNAHSGATTEKVTMADNTPAPNATGTFTQAQMDTAVASAKAEGAAESSTRIGAILNSTEAKGREATAMSMALNADMAAMPAASVITVLGTTPLTGKVDATPAVPTPEQRAAGDQAEMGADDPTPSADAKAKDNGWGETVAEINKNV